MHRSRNEELVDAQIGEREPGKANPKQEALGAIEPVERKKEQACRCDERIADPGDPLILGAFVHCAIVGVALEQRIAQCKRG